MLRVAFVALLLGCCACAHAATPAGSLDILLTNDDGYDARGLLVMRAALLAEGHRVSVIAPSSDRSGSSVSLTTRGTLRWRAVARNVVAVDGTPADCVSLALTMLRDTPPDLIVSGVNFGQNVGSGTVSSGTVGAAVTGASMGVPSIAVSQTVDPNDLRGTERYFPAAAKLTVALVRALGQNGRRPLLPSGMALNVNHPPRMGADVAGVRLTRQGSARLYDVVYTRAGEGEAIMRFAPSSLAETVPDADTTALAAGYVSVTPLDASWTAHADFEQLRGLADTLDALSRAAASTVAR